MPRALANSALSVFWSSDSDFLGMAPVARLVSADSMQMTTVLQRRFYRDVTLAPALPRLESFEVR